MKMLSKEERQGAMCVVCKRPYAKYIHNNELFCNECVGTPMINSIPLRYGGNKNVGSR